ncbi:flagellar biosynthesis protein FlhF [uncultured Metabacillus sp.]|uniref:flagellar biosynthesis protein FlhF n=1 Tax=uncultured Metabacillus sp. TaxID=2860135 RepID=UPI002635E138|nr:flagellar biosynthesis protein FlhF [uncultured Metabacillus sp.]
MKVKKYVASSMQEAMNQIRSEMGNDAVILNSKVTQSGGFLGLFSKKNIEVIAAIDPEISQQLVGKTKHVRNAAAFETPKREAATDNEPLVKEQNQQLLDEIQQLKGLIQSFSTDKKSEFYPEPLRMILKEMTKQEVHASLRGRVISKLIEYWHSENGDVTFEQLREKEAELFKNELEGIEFGGISFQKKYINVIGPTGVGKTTTLAKLAAECVLEKKKSVAFITTDTYRIAAIDQLKTYANILKVPIEVCYNIDDFIAAKKKLDQYDFIFIDTAGRNFLESQYVKDLQKIIDFNHEIETFLVLAATAKPVDMLAVYEQFSVIPIDKLIFTKLDETSTRGPLLDVIMKTNLGIAYTTHGQNVPDDIEEATRERIVEQILR